MKQDQAVRDIFKKKLFFPILSSLILFILSFGYFIFVNNPQANEPQYYKQEGVSDNNFTTIARERSWPQNVVLANAELFAGNTMRENFTAQDDNLGIIAVPFNAHNKSINDKIIFRIKETDKNDWYIQNTYNANQFQTDVPFPFGFPTIKNSKNISFTFEIESLAGKPGDSLSLSKTNQYFLTKYIFSKSELIQNPSRLIEFVNAKINTNLLLLSNGEKLIIFLITLLPLPLYFLIKRILTPGTEMTGNIYNKKKKNIIKRIQWIDVGKGMGLLLVILGHLVKIGTSLAIWIFSFHIPLFFFLSGYVSKFTEADGKYSFKKILVNLIVPYFIFTFIGLVVSLIIPGWRPSSFGRVISDVFYNVNPESLHVGQIWFLFCLAVVEVMFLLFLKLKIKNKYIIAVCIGLFAIIASLISKYNIGIWVLGNHMRLPWKIDTAFMGLFFFSAGYYSKLLKLFSKIFSRSTYKNLVFAAISFIINLYIGIHLNSAVNLAANSYGNLIYFVVAAISGIIFIIYLSKYLENISLLIYMGKNTLPIFSLHSFFLYFYAFLLSNILGRNITIMVNIPLFLSVVGLVLVSTVSLIIPVIYNNTVQKLIFKLK